MKVWRLLSPTDPTLIEFIKKEQKRYRLWAWMDSHAGCNSRYNAGYLQALTDIKAKLGKES